jgi:hypothetical protein
LHTRDGWAKPGAMDVEAHIQPLWRDLAPEGFPVEGCRFEVLRDQERSRKRHVARVEAPDGRKAILKQVTPPQPDAAALVSAQRKVAAAMTGKFRFAGVLAADPVRGATVIEFAPGRPALELLLVRRKRRAVLARCGAWLHAFHEATHTWPAPFDPAPWVSAIDRMAHEALRAGPPAQAARRIRPRLARLHALADAVAGRPLRRVRVHGDLHLESLLVDGPHVTGIDLAKDQTGPVGQDLARLTVSLVETFGATGPGLPDAADATALAQGYPGLWDEPSRDVMLAVALLRRWLQRLGHSLGPEAEHRDQNLRRAARMFFGD